MKDNKLQFIKKCALTPIQIEYSCIRINGYVKKSAIKKNIHKKN